VVHIIEAGPDRFADVAAVWNTVWPQVPTDVEELLHDEQTLPELEKNCYFLALEDHAAIGLAELSHVHGSYHPLMWSLHVSVIPGYRNRGIGTALSYRARSFIASDPISITTTVPEDDEYSLQFAQKRGYREAKRDFQSALDLSKLDPKLLDCPNPDGVEIFSFGKVDSPELRRKLHELFESVRGDIPRAHPPTRLEFEHFDRMLLGSPQFSPDGTRVAMVGEEPVGFTWFYFGATPGRIDQGLTAVLADHRGKGLASALKAQGTKWALDAGYKTIHTDNDTRNAPMLAINERLGYERLPGTITMVWTPS
jgi:GNAT superfamily N-acetyltransferase